ncbi:hypothetical protein [Stenotrophomonas tuberculopleuritidis]|uniref:hypothetical protein n=1 Tax=Stenotrophomonas tuberculopleuritidis TaxID=3055079 RepID=UPI0026E562C5|nr:hypothetical protein [Stenotrophomonas sp. 704A1]
MYQLTQEPDIIKCKDTGAFIPRGHWMWRDYEAWILAGNAPSPVPLPYPAGSAEHLHQLRRQAEQWMCEYAQTLGHSSVESCCSYTSSVIPGLACEARAMVAWRDAVTLALKNLTIASPDDAQNWDQIKQRLPQPEMFDWLCGTSDSVPPVRGPAEI